MKGAVIRPPPPDLVDCDEYTDDPPDRKTGPLPTRHRP